MQIMLRKQTILRQWAALCVNCVIYQTLAFFKYNVLRTVFCMSCMYACCGPACIVFCFVLLFCLLLLFSFSYFTDVHTWFHSSNHHTWFQSSNHHTCSRSPINHSPLKSPLFVSIGGVVCWLLVACWLLVGCLLVACWLLWCWAVAELWLFAGLLIYR